MFWIGQHRAASCRMPVNYTGYLSAIILILCIHAAPALANYALLEATILVVNDGDTVVIKMEDKTYRTRLIGIDAPEMGQEPWGKKAKKHLREILKRSGRIVQVETDITRYDKYDRLLAYLWLDNKTMLNELMLRDGYAVLFTIQPNSKYVERLKKAQHAAQNDHAGVWGPNGLTERPIEYKKTHPRK